MVINPVFGVFGCGFNREKVRKSLLPIKFHYRLSDFFRFPIKLCLRLPFFIRHSTLSFFGWAVMGVQRAEKSIEDFSIGTLVTKKLLPERHNSVRTSFLLESVEDIIIYKNPAFGEAGIARRCAIQGVVEGS